MTYLQIMEEKSAIKIQTKQQVNGLHIVSSDNCRDEDSTESYTRLLQKGAVPVEMVMSQTSIQNISFKTNKTIAVNLWPLLKTITSYRNN